jgi:hypothetical protein
MDSSWSTAGIYDAGAFKVGDSAKVHRTAHFTPRRVVGVCGVVAYACELRDGERYAYWAAGKIDCPTCIARLSSSARRALGLS